MVGLVKNLGVSTPVAGAGVALAAGLLLGAAMRPQLAIGELSPQPIGAWSGALGPDPEAAAADDSLAYAGYGGQLPTFVIGADFLAAAAPPEEPAPSVSEEPAADDKARTTTPQSEAAPAAEGHATAAAAQTPNDNPGEAVPAEPAVPTLAIDENPAPPEATGDTSRHEEPPTALAH